MGQILGLNGAACEVLFIRSLSRKGIRSALDAGADSDADTSTANALRMYRNNREADFRFRRAEACHPELTGVIRRRHIQASAPFLR